jgi:hypothetical protein
MTADLADYVTNNYKNLNQGVNEIIDTLRQLRTASTYELRGKFSPDEWKFLTDSLNGTMTDGPFRTNAKALAAHCEDSDLFDGTAAKWGIDIKTLTDKIEALTAAQVEALYWRVEGFWDEPKDLDAFATF